MGIVIVFIPLLIYLLAALSVKEDIKHPDDYFAAFKKVGRTEFTSSSIAYGFQVSTIYPFLFWGASSFLFVPLVNSIFWGVGILVFYLSFSRISRFIGSGNTLPGLIGETYGKNARLGAALLTIVGFIGYTIAELWFGSRVLLSVFPTNTWVYFSIFVFVLFVAIYLFKAGQLSSIRTDQLQLIFTYFGIFGIIIYLLYLVFNSGASVGGELTWGLLILSVLTPIILLVRRTKFVSLNTTLDKILNGSITIFFFAITGLSVLVISRNSQSTAVKNFFNLEGFGYAGLVSLILLPLSWQFVDLTNWQRLLSVKQTTEGLKVNQDIQKGLLNFAIESPFTWMLFIVFGLLITTSLPNWTFEDVLIDFPKQLIDSTIILEQILGYMFIVSVISIMLSTVDSFFMGISFTYTYDINRQSRRLIQGKKDIDVAATTRVLNKGKYFGALAVLAALVLFVVFDKSIQGGGGLFINLLLTFYSAALSFLPLVIGMLFFKRKPNSSWALASMLIGAIAGIGIGFYATLSNPLLAWYPVIVCISTSTFIYFVGCLAKGM